jgi:hypothetical protein
MHRLGDALCTDVEGVLAWLEFSARTRRPALPEDMRRQKLSRPRVITEWLRFLVSDHRAAERLAKGEE